MAYSLPPLPYDYDALEPYIDALTMNIHHTKHHQTYINNTNAALESAPELKGLEVGQLCSLVGTDKLPESVATKIRNNGGGIWNHTFFWQVMGKPGDNNGPSAELKAAIDEAFGGVEPMKEKFSAAAAGVFGSGWAWLGIKPDGSLSITTTPNQDNPLMPVASQPMAPILGIDVWEHAYYILRQNRRPEYISAWWNVVNWETVNTFYSEAKSAAKL